MLTDEQLEYISAAIVPLFQYLEKEVIADIARRIAKTLTYSRTAELQAIAMMKLGYSPAKIRKEAMKMLNADPDFRKAVAKNTLEYKREVRKIINDITKAAYKANEEIVAGAGNMSWANDLSVWKEAGKELTDNSYLKELMDAFSAQTNGELKNMTQTTGFKTMSGYEGIENAYRKELDKAVIKICSGTFSQDKVVRDVVHDLAQSGLRSIDFASGYSMQLDTAARLAIRTGCHQLAGKIQDENIKQTGENLVYVSKHWGARNKGTGHANHEQWQGRVYYIKEGKDYSEEAKRIGQDYITDLWRATGYSVDGAHESDPTGLYGYNCRHKHYVWFEGASSFPKNHYEKEPAPVTIDGKTYDYYAMTQKMRAMERNIRAMKREKEAEEALGNDTRELQVKIKEKTAKYKEFCKTCGVPEETSRLRYECGTADLKKTKAWNGFEVSVAPKKEIIKGAHGIKGDKVSYNEQADFTISIPEYSDELNDALSKAARKVAKAGSQNKYEYSAIIDVNTCKEVDFGTSEDYSSVSSYYKFLREHLEGKYIMVHNHNTHSSLSLPDLQELASWQNLDGVISAANDGFINCVVSNGRKTKDYLYSRYLEGDYGVDKSMGEIDRELFMVDLAVNEFAKGGMIVYGE